MTASIAYFIRVGNTLFSSQFVRNGPNNGCEYNHLWNLGDDFAKQYAAPTVGVDQGMPGRKIPAYAMAIRIMPSVNQNTRFMLRMLHSLKTLLAYGLKTGQQTSSNCSKDSLHQFHAHTDRVD